MRVNKESDIANYQRAYEEWSERVGSAKTQMRNWRIAFMLSLFVLILLLICLVMVLGAQKRYVYVAEVRPQDNVVNLRPVDQAYEPTAEQTEYMIGRFIDAIMTLPLDPVVAKTKWLYAYSLTQGRAIEQLNHYMQTNNPLADIGRVTRTVEIRNMHPVSKNSYEATWTQTEYNQQGKIENVVLYDGIFTVAMGPLPTTMQALLNNPFGLQVVYFSFSNEGQ
jgi:type IV secretory pathway TrbF-like protein